MPDLATYILVSVIVLGGAFVQSVVGFGYNIIGVPTLTILTNARTAVSVISIPSFMNSILIVWRISRGEGQVPIDLRRLAPLLITTGAGTLAGATLLAALDPAIVLVSLGVLLLLFIFTARARQTWQPNPAHATRLALMVGSVTGILNGLAGVSGPTLAPYLYSLRLDKHEFVYYINVLF